MGSVGFSVLELDPYLAGYLDSHPDCLWYYYYYFYYYFWKSNNKVLNCPLIVLQSSL